MTTGHVEQHGGCHYNGVQYWAGDSFRSTDGCNTCYCSAHGGAMCTEMFCQNSKSHTKLNIFINLEMNDTSLKKLLSFIIRKTIACPADQNLLCKIY